MKYNAELVNKEGARIEEVYRQRDDLIPRDLYAPWQPAENLIISERKRTVAQMLNTIGKFPLPTDKCLEIGYGRLGWLADMLSWGVPANNLHGIELDAIRASHAKRILPSADLRVGDASQLPWLDDSFEIVITSTVFSSILNEQVRILIANEIKRVLKPNGVLIWYDLATNNPQNSNVQGIKKEKLKILFRDFNMITKKVTLAPPIARLIAPMSFTLAVLLNSFPFVKTHLTAIIVKK